MLPCWGDSLAAETPPQVPRPRLAYLATIVVSTAVSILLIVSAEDVMPKRSGPEQLIFLFHGELVFLDVIGGLLPLLISLEFLVLFGLIIRSTRRIAFLDLIFWVMIPGLAVVLTVIFSVATALYGGLSLPDDWSIALIPLGSVVGVAYFTSRRRGMNVAVVFAECYALGTLAVLLSDLLRTIIQFPLAPAVSYGGGGTHDLVFWFGLYIGGSVVIFASFGSLYSAVSKGVRRDGEMRAKSPSSTKPISS
jgi:hypothetical protein